MNADEAPKPKNRNGGLGRRALAAILWMLLGEAGKQAVQVGVTVALARILVPEQFGLAATTLVIARLSTLLSQIGSGIRLVQAARIDDDDIRTGATLSTLIGCACMAAVWYLAAPLAALLGAPQAEPLLQVISVVFLLDGLTVVPAALAQRALRFRLISGIELSAYTVSAVAIAVPMALAGYGALALACAHVGKSALVAIAMISAVPHPRRFTLHRRALAEQLHFSGGNGLTKLFNFLAQQGDYLIVGRMLGPSALGIYSRAYQLMALPTLTFTEAVNRVLFPIFSRAQEDEQRLAHMHSRSVALVALLTMPISAILCIHADEIIRILLGPGWEAAIVPLQIFAIGTWLRTIAKTTSVMARSCGMVYRQAGHSALYALWVVIGASIGCAYGVIGVAVGVTCALALNVASLTWLCQQLTGMSTWVWFASQGPGLRLALLVALADFTATHAARTAGLPAIASLAAGLGAACMTTLVAGSLAPRIFLGEHGRWLLHTGRDLLRKRTPVLTQSDS